MIVVCIVQQNNYWISKQESSYHPFQVNSAQEGDVLNAPSTYEEHSSFIVAGGYKPSWDELKTVEVLNLNREIWSSLGQMPIKGYMWNPNRLIFLQTFVLLLYEPKHVRWLVVEDLPTPAGYLHERCFVFNAGIGRKCDFA